MGTWMAEEAAPDGGPFSGADAVDVQLPRDSADYTARTFEAFTTLYPVNLDIWVELYEAGENGEASKLPTGTADVRLRLRSADGTLIYEGLTGDDGRITAAVYLPAAPEDIELSLSAAGFADRSVTISDMVRYSRIERTMAMARLEDYLAARSLEPDFDGDGVPDAYDADYDDAGTAFKAGIPAEGKLTVAFEDLFGRADAGDADYNDFIAAYTITENLNSEGTGLDSVRFDVTAQKKIAGYDHVFGIRIDSFSGTARVEGEYLDTSGALRDFSDEEVTAPLEVELFESTSLAEGESVWFEIDFIDPDHQNLDKDAGDVVVDRPPYNPYLYVKNTGYDVHLLGEESIEGSENPDGSLFMDENNFPWGLLVPADWINPEETRRIEEYYPNFTPWRLSGGSEHRDWYLNYVDPDAPAQTVEMAADINSGGAGSGPQYLTVYDGALYFSADDGVDGRELWRWNGSTAELVADIHTSGDGNPDFLTVYGGSLYFRAKEEGEIFGFLYRYDGSTTGRVADLEIPVHLQVYENELFLSARNSTFPDRELWSYDGSNSPTRVADINSGSGDSRPAFLTEYGGTLYYQADDGSGVELWSYNATDGAQLVDGGAAGEDPQYFREYNNKLYFQADDGSTGYELWEYDGASESTRRVIDLNTGVASGLTFSYMVVFDNVLYFVGNDGNYGNELWSYDGSSVTRVTDLNDGASDGLAAENYFAVYDNELYFAGDDGSTGYELYKYDGSTVTLVKELHPTGSSNPGYLTVLNSRLYFSADDGTDGMELWVLY
jgi:ELWxxDGT repeat protein